MKRLIVFLLAISVVIVGCSAPTEEVVSSDKSTSLGGKDGQKKGPMETDDGLKPD